jgi:ribose transport system permease protein
MMKTESAKSIWVVDWFKWFMSIREGVLILVIAGMFVIMSFASEFFLLPQTMLNLLMSFTVEGIIAIGMVVLLISGGMDLSAGANMALSGVVSAMCYVAGYPLVVAVLFGLVCGLVVGLINGVLVSFVGLNPFICTLGMQMTLSGFMMMLTRGKAVQVGGNFSVIGAGKMFGIQYPVYILLALVVLFDILLRKSRFFRRSYYVGGNENAAKLNGINVRAVKIVNYSLTGVLSALTGIIFASRLTTASITVGGDTALRVLTACIIGGASLNGGEGTVFGAFLGIVFMQLLSSSFNIMNVNTFIKTFVTGLILIAAIMVDVLNERRKSAKYTIAAQKKVEAE